MSTPVNAHDCACRPIPLLWPRDSARRVVSRRKRPKYLAARGARDSAAARDRRGAAVIEFAVCIPVIVLLVLSSIEATSYIYLKQSLQIAAYEGVRTALERGADEDDAEACIENILASRRIRDAEIRFPLGQPQSVSRGDLVAVEISAPTETNSPLAGRFLSNRTLTVRTVMVKE